MKRTSVLALIFRVAASVSASPSVSLARESGSGAVMIAGHKSATETSATESAKLPKVGWAPTLVEFGAEGIVVNHPRFEIVMPPDAASSTAIAAPEMIYAVLKPTFDALEGIAVSQIAINGGTVNVHFGARQTEKLTELTATFAIHPAAGLTTGSGAFRLRGETLEFETAFAKPDKDAQTGDIPLRLKIVGAGLAASFEGLVRHSAMAHLDGKVDITVTDLRKLAAWAGISLSKGGALNSFRALGTMAWTAGLLSMSEAVFTLDDNQAQGVLSLDLRKERASVQGTLAMERLDLSSYFPVRKQDAKLTGLGSLVPEMSTETELGAPILRDFDADVRLSVNEIKINRFSTGKGAISLTLRSGTLLSDIAELDLFDGSLVGQLEFNTSDPVAKISARGLLDNIESGDAMGWITNAEPIRGRARLVANLAGAGHTIGELVQSFKGDARLTMTEGGAFRVDVDRLMKSAENKPVTGWVEASTGETEFAMLEANLMLNNARISTRSLRADRDNDSIVAFGTINLVAKEVAVRLSVVEKLDNGTRSPVIDSSRPTLSMKGPWDEPLISVEKQARLKPANPVRTRTYFAKSSVD